MKQGKPVITLVMVIFALTIGVYFGSYVFDTFNEPYTTTHTYSYTHTESVQANGVLIRQEQVLPAQSGIVELQCSEGEKLAVNQTVAYVYESAQAQQDSAELEAIQAEIAVLESVLGSGVGVDSSAGLDGEVLKAVAALRSCASRQELGELEDLIHDVKSSLLRRSYTYGEQVTAEQLRTRLQTLRADYSEKNRRTDGTYTRVRAKVSGTFSSLVDGLETVLTPSEAMTLTPSVLEEVIAAGADPLEAVGKLITGSRWYFAANIPAEVSQSMRAGSTALLRFTGDFEQDVEMRVDSISAPQNGMACVVFSTDRYLGKTTLLRFQSAELVFHSYSGLRIPKQALHMEKYELVNEETGEVTRSQMLGVYVLMAGRAEFKQVKVVTESEDFYVVTGVSSGADALRPGDEIIVRAVGLYDGKLMDM
jgi:multidrug efflux pump subunit AcrA (membrane-fusion protein)